MVSTMYFVWVRNPDLLLELHLISHSPRCPQNYVDFRHFLRIPEDIQVEEAPEDEFKCLNLDVTMPAQSTVNCTVEQSYPVLVWIHGR